jgi:hypothetical protein
MDTDTVFMDPRIRIRSRSRLVYVTECGSGLRSEELGWENSTLTFADVALDQAFIQVTVAELTLHVHELCLQWELHGSTRLNLQTVSSFKVLYRINKCYESDRIWIHSTGINQTELNTTTDKTDKSEVQATLLYKRFYENRNKIK